jgi:hypothetical protein
MIRVLFNLILSFMDLLSNKCFNFICFYLNPPLNCFFNILSNMILMNLLFDSFHPRRICPLHFINLCIYASQFLSLSVNRLLHFSLDHFYILFNNYFFFLMIYNIFLNLDILVLLISFLNLAHNLIFECSYLSFCL